MKLEKLVQLWKEHNKRTKVYAENHGIPLQKMITFWNELQILGENLGKISNSDHRKEITRFYFNFMEKLSKVDEIPTELLENGSIKDIIKYVYPEHGKDHIPIDHLQQTVKYAYYHLPREEKIVSTTVVIGKSSVEDEQGKSEDKPQQLQQMQENHKEDAIHNEEIAKIDKIQGSDQKTTSNLVLKAKSLVESTPQLKEETKKESEKLIGESVKKSKGERFTEPSDEFIGEPQKPQGEPEKTENESIGSHFSISSIPNTVYIIGSNPQLRKDSEKIEQQSKQEYKQPQKSGDKLQNQNETPSPDEKSQRRNQDTLKHMPINLTNGKNFSKNKVRDEKSTQPKSSSGHVQKTKSKEKEDKKNKKTNWIMTFLIGIAVIIILFFLFKFLKEGKEKPKKILYLPPNQPGNIPPQQFHSQLKGPYELKREPTTIGEYTRSLIEKMRKNKTLRRPEDIWGRRA